jgi:hypothetical protein
MTELPFKFDEIGYWSELKLEIVEKYGAAYTTAFNRSPNLKKYYIDAFSGAGVHISKTTGTQVEGSPARALNVSPPSTGFTLSTLTKTKPTISVPCMAAGETFTFTPGTRTNI